MNTPYFIRTLTYILSIFEGGKKDKKAAAKQAAPKKETVRSGPRGIRPQGMGGGLFGEHFMTLSSGQET